MTEARSVYPKQFPLPFLLNDLDPKLGTSLFGDSVEWNYNPSKQRTNILEIIEKEDASRSEISCTGVFGDSSPTTTSSVAGTTGVFGGDSDQSNDDQGTD